MLCTEIQFQADPQDIARLILFRIQDRWPGAVGTTNDPIPVTARSPRVPTQYRVQPSLTWQAGDPVIDVKVYSGSAYLVVTRTGQTLDPAEPLRYIASLPFWPSAQFSGAV